MTPLHSKLDAIVWPIHRPMDSPSYVAPLQEWMLYYARRVDAAFALLDVCRNGPLGYVAADEGMRRREEEMRRKDERESRG